MILDYQFKDENLINTAFTHSSYANEHKVICNERLEFLGDAILGFVVGAYIYKKYPNWPEGRLTKLRASVVCETMLAKKGREIKCFAALPYEKFSCCLRAVCRIAETFSPASLAAAFSQDGKVTFRRTVRFSLARR